MNPQDPPSLLKFNEDIALRLETLIQTRKHAEAAEFLMDDSHIQDIKTHHFNSLIDKLCDAHQAHIFCNILFWAINTKPSFLTKYAMKRYFYLIARQTSLELGEIILNQYLESFTTEQLPKELLFRMYQYYISACLRCSEIRFAIELFEALRKGQEFTEEFLPIVFKIYEALIKACVSHEKGLFIEEARTLLEDVASRHPNDVFFNKLIDFAAKHNDLAFSEYIFKVMVSSSIQPSIVTYNTLIDSYFKQNKYNQAWILFELLKKSDKKPDNFTYTTMINGIKSMEKPDLNRAFQLFNEYKQINTPDQIIYNCLIDACINAENMDRAFELFSEIKTDSSLHLDEVSFNTLIKGCCRSKKLSQAITLLEEMKQMGVKPNRITYNSLIDTCVKSGRMSDAWRFFDEMNRVHHIKPDNFTYSILINGIKSNHTNKEELDRALAMLDKLQNETPEFKSDEILYNSLIDTCVKFNEINKGLALYEEMKKKNIEPSEITYGILIKAFGKMNDLVKAFKIFEQMKLKQMKINDVTYGCLLDACVKNQRMDLALILVEKIKQDNIALNTIIYTTLIKGFSRINKLEEAYQVFCLMKENPKTLPNVITYNCMLDASVRCGHMEKVLGIFEEMQGNNSLKPDLITYSTIIKGFCKQKDIEKANSFLHLMLNAKVRPDEPLINLLLECCYTTGKLDKGIEIFSLMNSMKIPASNITYSILIKLYGKTRKINKVMGILETMKKSNIKPTLITYTNLIQACFKAKRSDYLLSILGDIEKDGLIVDAIFYTKVISGLVAMNNVALACKYLKKAVLDRMILGQDVYHNMMRELGNVEIPEKAETLQFLQQLVQVKSRVIEMNSKENVPMMNQMTPRKEFGSAKKVPERETEAVQQKSVRKFTGQEIQARKVVIDDKENEWTYSKQKSGQEGLNMNVKEKRDENLNSENENAVENKMSKFGDQSKPKRTFWVNQENKESGTGFTGLLKNRFR